MTGLLRRHWIGGGMALVFASASRVAKAHPFHATMTELRFNSQTNSLEAALRVTPNDLEDALSKRVADRVNLERRADIDALITGYIRDVFIVHDQSGQSVAPTWVGKQIESHQIAWLYFEFPLAPSVRSVKLRNRAFFEIASHQLNTVQVQVGQRKQTLTFSPGARDKAKRVVLRAGK